jgi:hypothetical protein|tara:strand:+ start:844 stop:1011 length:168 start_codon:yes stop_codon:yes gene_type:complete
MKRLWFILPAIILSDLIFGQGWTKTFDGYYYAEAYSVQQTTNSGYIITGTVEIKV